MCVCVCLNVCVCMCVWMYVWMCVCGCMCVDVCVISYNALPLHAKLALVIVIGLLNINEHVSQVFEPVCFTFEITSKFYLCY